MAIKWSCPNKDVLIKWVTDSLGAKDLSNWEYEFLNSLRYQLAYKDELTKEQVDKLESIYAEKT